ncbi:unnamed protein product [Rotaria sp. Silwood2]|nr:unnamed protein product [Rotaria sp. Silwood2]CAF3950495.1 unnamed protein product [Rotaria sp. Silwood2]
MANDSGVYNNEDDNIHHDDHSSDAGYEWNDKENVKEHYELKNYSISFKKEYVDFANSKDSSGKRRRSMKTIHRRYRSGSKSRLYVSFSFDPLANP